MFSTDPTPPKYVCRNSEDEEMRFRAIIVVESEDMDLLLKKMDKLGNFKVIDVFDSKIGRWIMPSTERTNLLRKIRMRVMDA